MGKKRKLWQFDQLGQMENVFQVFDYHHPELIDHEGKEVNMKGCWGADYFGNDAPIILELACGKAEYVLGLAAKHPDKNFIGIDRKGNRLWRGAQTALDKQLNNTAFIRSKIELIHHFFNAGEVAEIWITFADPHLKGSPNNRLTSPRMLDVYKKFLRKDGPIHVKIDDDTLYEFTLSVIEEQGLTILENDPDIYKCGDREGSLSIKTYYERKHLTNKKAIKYLKFLLH